MKESVVRPKKGGKGEEKYKNQNNKMRGERLNKGMKSE
jgi:hypothetical protein